MKRTKRHSRTRKHSQQGIALIEMMIALTLLLVVAGGLMSLAAVSMATTENQGHLQARTAEYAQDKMEQLLAMTFCDNTTDTTVFPAAQTLNTGLGGCAGVAPNQTANAAGGLNINAPTAGFVDYVDAAGNPVAAAAGWQYIRVWQITVPAGNPLLKQITVTCQVRNAIGNAVSPSSTVVALKSYPF